MKYARIATLARLFAAGVVFAATLSGCVNDPGAPAHFNPSDPDTPDTGLPGRPTALMAYAGDGEVTLSWSAPAVGGVAGYRLYRSIDEAGTGTFSAWEFLSAADGTSYLDRAVSNNFEYRYRVSAVTASGLEGEFSVVVRAVPAVYTVTLEGGALFTRSRVVNLTLTAPLGTQLVRVSNTSDMSGAAFVTYAATLIWTLSEGDGPKDVYVEFRGPNGEGSGPHHVAIALDTVAEIRSIEVTGAGALVAPGDTVHLALDAEEAGGMATVDIAGRVAGIRLHDDGTRGDATPDDGVYEVDYVILGGDDVAEAMITGRFIDRAENQSPAVISATRLTIGVPPLAVTLQAPSDSTLTSLHLNWNVSTAEDFASYRLYRAGTAGVDTASARVLVTQIGTSGTASFVDNGLLEDTPYHYLLYVFDRAGLSAKSNEVVGRTANHVPAGVSLAPASGISPTSLVLEWGESAAADFSAYRIYRATAAGVDSNSTLVATISRRDDNTREVNGLVENTDFYFRVFVRDRGGMLAGSNEIIARTANLPPPAVVLATPVVFTDTDVTLSWSASAAPDFSEYRVYRDTTAAVTESSFQVRTLNDKTIVSLVDSGLRENTRYYYRVYVVDTGDSLAASGVVGVTTVNVRPAPVTLAQPDSISIGTTTAHLSWGEATAHDFAEYRLRRATTPGVTGSSTSVFVSDLPTLDFFDDLGLTGSTTYYYRVFVRDSGGLETGSNEVRIVTD